MPKKKSSKTANPRKHSGLDRELTVHDLAAHRGKSERTIRRWLNRLDRASAGRVIMRDGKRIFTTLRALEEANPRLVERRALDSNPLAELEKQSRADARRIKRLEAQVIKLTGALALFLGSDEPRRDPDTRAT